MELNIPKSSNRVVGGLRVSDDIYEWICKMAEEYGVTNQEVIRHILQKVYEDELSKLLKEEE